MSRQPLILAKKFEGELWIRASDVSEIVKYLESQAETTQPEILKGNADLVADAAKNVCSYCFGSGSRRFAWGDSDCPRCLGTGRVG